MAEIPWRTAWGLVYSGWGQVVVGGERGLIRQRFYAPAPAPPAVSDAATIMLNEAERVPDYLWDYHRSDHRPFLRTSRNVFIDILVT